MKGLGVFLLVNVQPGIMENVVKNQERESPGG